MRRLYILVPMLIAFMLCMFTVGQTQTLSPPELVMVQGQGEMVQPAVEAPAQMPVHWLQWAAIGAAFALTIRWGSELFGHEEARRRRLKSVGHRLRIERRLIYRNLT